MFSIKHTRAAGKHIEQCSRRTRRSRCGVLSSWIIQNIHKIMVHPYSTYTQFLILWFGLLCCVLYHDCLIDFPSNVYYVYVYVSNSFHFQFSSIPFPYTLNAVLPLLLRVKSEFRFCAMYAHMPSLAKPSPAQPRPSGLSSALTVGTVARRLVRVPTARAPAVGRRISDFK